MRWITACLVFAFSALIVASVSVNAEDEPTYENPELQFKFNLKETQNSEGNDDLSPQNKLIILDHIGDTLIDTSVSGV